MLGRIIETTAKRLAGFLQADHMRTLGIAHSMRIAKAVNRVRYRRQLAWRREQYHHHFAELIEANGAPVRPVAEIRDGWLLDPSRSLPHLGRLLADATKIIDKRGGIQRKKPGAYRSFFQNILEPEDLVTYPSILDFALSSDVLAVVSNYLKCIPAMPTSLPGGVRFAESSIEYDETPGTFKDSQLFHIDYFSKPCVYMIVLLRDVTIEHGPFCFAPASVSQKAASALHYGSRGMPYRLRDDQVYSVLDKKEVMSLSYPQGTVLFLDPSACFHFGSRNSVKARYQLMYAYGTTCRTDFNEFVTRRHVYPDRPGDSRLAKMVLNPDMVEN